MACGLALILLAALAALASARAPTINVHVVPHSHDDVGWLKTVDQYYYGANNSIQDASVSLVLDTVVEQLVADPRRKFIYAEQAFFTRWWWEQSEETKATVRRLVQTHQLEFVDGGWTQHDEACPYYVTMVDQTTLGHQFLLEQFEYVPRIGWQIDTFGHSATQPSLLSAAVGFDALYFARVDYQDRDLRRLDRSMEMVWRASPSLGPDSEIFSGVFLGGSYGPPPGMNWNYPSNDAPVMDDSCLEDGNVKQLVDLFVSTAEQYASYIRDNNVMFLMGSDFHYANARSWFRNLDKIIDYVNRDGRVKAFYSNPLLYTEAKHKANLTLPLKTDDFMPICQDHPEESGRRGHAYWAGYFTSRPLLKFFERTQSAFLQAARQLQFLARLPLRNHIDGDVGGCNPFWRHWNATTDLFPLEMAVAELTHHDGLTGTSKQHVAYDYARRLALGATVARLVVGDAFRELTRAPPSVSFNACPLLNESVCPETMRSSFQLVVYNPLPIARAAHLSLPVTFAHAKVTDAATGAAVPAEVFLYRNRNELAIAVPLCALCTRVLRVSAAIEAADATTHAPVQADAVNEIENEYLRVTIDPATGRIASIFSKEDNVQLPVDQNYQWYEGNADPGKGAGAYMFRPANCNTDASNISCVGDGGSCSASFEAYVGTVRSEITQSFSSWVNQTVRLWAGARHVELEWSVGPIPIGDNKGKEIVSRFTTPLATRGLFTTDANGYELQTRRRNYRATFKLNLTEPQAANYFPVGSVLAIQGELNAADGASGPVQLSITPDRSQGGTSLRDGQAELLVHRRLLADDGEGVGEPLNETLGITPYPDAQRVGPGITVKGRHFVHVSKASNASRLFRATQHALFHAPVVMFAGPTTWSVPPPAGNTSTPFPPNVGLMTLERRASDQVLLRVQHLFGVGEDAELSKPASLNLPAVFAFLNLRVSEVTEMSLTANQRRSALASRLRFRTEPALSPERAFSALGSEGVLEGTVPSVITLTPLQIRTFLLNV